MLLTNGACSASRSLRGCRERRGVLAKPGFFLLWLRVLRHREWGQQSSGEPCPTPFPGSLSELTKQEHVTVPKAGDWLASGDHG